jgi:CRISPR/Cas system-associated protein Cas5 (RAMP superfamily)
MGLIYCKNLGLCEIRENGFETEKLAKLDFYKVESERIIKNIDSLNIRIEKEKKKLESLNKDFNVLKQEFPEEFI